MKKSNIIIMALGLLVAGFAGGYFMSSQNAAQRQENTPDTQTAQKPSNDAPTSQEEEIWTCSMHPQIRQAEPGECPICGMDLILLDANTSSDPLVLEMTVEAAKLANIQTTVLGDHEGAGEKLIRLSGKIQEDERLASSQVAHVPGRIEKLFVSFTGEQVRRGQKLATVYSPELITAQQELLEAIKLRDVSPGLVEAARNKLKFWKISQSVIDRIEQRGSIRETFNIYADADGIVSKRRVAVGDYVKVGEPLFDLMNLNNVWVLFDAYEEDLANIRLGDRIEFTTPSVPNHTFRTRVTFIDPVMNPTTRVAYVRTEMNNSQGHLKPEMFVTGILKKKRHGKSKLTVPKSAVLWTGKRSVVYVKKPDTVIPSFEFREIEIGDALGDIFEVVAGLELGEEVVTYGAFSIDAAAQLNNQTSMMNKNVMLKGADHTEHLPDYTDQTPQAFKIQLADVAESYIPMKDAFVATNTQDAAQSAQKVLDQIAQVDMNLIKGPAHIYWMDQLKAMKAHIEKITSLDDIEEQRKQFDFFSEALIKSVKVFGIPKDKYYVQHCPMANDNQGADWISKEKAIKNPYFGEKMLTCGITQDSITKDFKNPPMEQASLPRTTGHNH